MTDNRTKLIETGADLMWQAGYTATSPRQVIVASGVGQGSFYHHFPTKVALGIAAIGANAADILAGTQRALSGDEPGAIRLRSYLLGDRNALAGCKIGGLTYDQAVVEDAALIEPISTAFQQISELLESAISDAQQEGAVRGDIPAAALATMVISVVQGGYVVSRARYDADLLREAAEAAYALLETRNTAR